MYYDVDIPGIMHVYVFVYTNVTIFEKDANDFQISVVLEYFIIC